MRKKSRSRKTSQQGNSSSEEKELLLKEDKDVEVNSKKVVLRRMESKISTAAPLASETEFEDVPVLTICPFCQQKVVTKTHFDKKKTICFCCCVCHPTLTYIFKDVIHSCPKCNNDVARYNRFLFCFRRKKTPKAAKRKDSLNPLNQAELRREESNSASSNGHSASQYVPTDLDCLNCDVILKSGGTEKEESGSSQKELKQVMSHENAVSQNKRTVDEKTEVMATPLMNIGHGLTQQNAKKKQRNKKNSSSLKK